MIPEVLKVITDQWQIAFGILLFIALGQGLVSTTLRFFFSNTLTSVEYFSLGVAGWLLPISLISLFWFALGSPFTGSLNWIIISAAILVLIAMLLHLKRNPGPDPSGKVIFFMLVFLLISILLRLVFVSRAILPSYFDSAQHYTMIKSILQNGRALPLASTTYYHPGFHILTAFLATVLNADIAKPMLILGQMVLAVTPISVFFSIKHVTRSNSAGIFAVILAAFGWYMPAHAVNWGKYPALTSLALLPFVLSLAYLLPQNEAEISLKKRWTLYTIFGFSIVILILFHSRSLFILAIVFLTWVIAAWQQRFSLITRSIIFVAVFITLVLEIIFIQSEAVFVPLFDPYLHKGIWVTVPVLLLSVFALKEYSQITFVCLLSMCLLLGGLFVPIRIPGYGALTLLDRPLVEMILYLPLSLLGGLGMAGLEKLLSKSLFWKFLRRESIHALAVGLIVIHALVTYNFYPSDCCVLVGNDDVAALDWMKNHLPMDAHIGISVTELNVLPSNALEGYTGGDAGIWITPLIDRVTIPLLYSSDFGQEAIKDKLCQSGITHIYVGELGQPFDSARFQEHPEWYKVLLSMPKVKVYEVIGCS